MGCGSNETIHYLDCAGVRSGLCVKPIRLSVCVCVYMCVVLYPHACLRLTVLKATPQKRTIAVMFIEFIVLLKDLCITVVLSSLEPSSANDVFFKQHCFFLHSIEQSSTAAVGFYPCAVCNLRVPEICVRSICVRVCTDMCVEENENSALLNALEAVRNSATENFTLSSLPY